MLTTKSGREIVADAVVAGIGLLPNLELAKTAGLATGNGIMVDEYLLTSRPDIYAAGDVAEFYNPALGKRMRVEHEDNANTMGLQAGRNMAGAAEPYHHLPFFYSDLFELGYEAVGELDAHLTVVADWKEPYQTGVLYYLKEKPRPGGPAMECVEKDRCRPPVDRRPRTIQPRESHRQARLLISEPGDKPERRRLHFIGGTRWKHHPEHESRHLAIDHRFTEASNIGRTNP